MSGSIIPILALAISTVIALVTLYAMTSDRHRVVTQTPSILTSMGIFGTFLGITVGLAGFNPDNIGGSVPHLFNSIKLAFWTSVAGVLGGILVKLRMLLWPIVDPASDEEREEGKALLERMVASLKGVENHLSDGGEGSLLAQLNELQADANDKSDAIKAALDDLYGATADAARVSDKLQGVLGSSFNELGDAVASSGQAAADQMRSVTEAVEGLHSAMGSDAVAMLEKLDKVNAGSGELAKKLQVALGDNAKSISETLAASNEKLATTIQGNRDAMAAQVTQAVTDLRDALVGPDGPAAALSSRLERNQVELAETLTQSLGRLQDAMGGDTQAVVARLESLGAASSAMADAMQSRLGEQSEALQASVAKSGADAAAQMRAVGESVNLLREALGSDSGQMLQKLDSLRDDASAVGERLGSLLGENGEQLARTLSTSNAALAAAIEDNRDKVSAQIMSGVNDLRDALVGPDGPAATLAQRMERNQVEMAEALTRSLTGLQDALGGDTEALIARLESLGSASGAMADALQSRLGEQSDALQATVAKSGADAVAQMRAVNESVDLLRQALGSDSGQLLEKLDSLQDNATQVGERLGSLLGEKGERLAEMLSTSNAALASAIEDNRDKMAAQIMAGVTDLRDALVGPEGPAATLAKRLEKSQFESAEAMIRSISALQDAMGSDSSQLADQLKGLQDASNAMASGLESALGDQTGAISEQLASNSETTVKQIRSVSDSLELLRNALGSDSKAMLEKLDSLKSGSTEIGQRLGEMLGANNEHLSELLNTGNAALTSVLENNRDEMARQVTQAVTELRDALVGPEGVASELGRSLQQGQAELAGALARASEGLYGVMGDRVGELQSQLAASGKDTAAQMQAVSEAIEGLQAAMGSDAGAMLDKLEGLREGSGELANRLSEALGKNADDLSAALRESNTQLAGTIEGNRDAMTAQIAQAATDLRDALVGSDGVMSDIGERMQRSQAELASVLDRVAEAAMGSFGEGMSGLSGDVNKMANGLMDAVDDLRLAIVGPEGATAGIAEEIRNAQEGTRDILGGIQAALEENTRRQVDYSPKALMEVLEEMIRNFNTQFSGQFWDKFGRFNTALGELNDWMESYRKQLADMVVQQGKTAKNMDTAARRFDEVASRSEIFIDVSKNISTLLGGLDSQRVQMESHLKRFAHIVDVTATSLESVEDKIETGHAQMNEHLKEIADRIEEQVIRVDHAMDEELTKALNTFGQQLAALSEKFVDDYTPLTERLREVVSLARPT